MTEEIIIDCAFYKDGVCASPINKTCEYCKNIDVSKCYHKQLIRLKQQHNDDTEEIAKLGLDVAILEQELKQANEDFSCIEKDYRLLNKRINALEQENEQMKSALEEIKSIANEFHYWNNNLTDASNVINSIKDKINELI